MMLRSTTLSRHAAYVLALLLASGCSGKSPREAAAVVPAEEMPGTDVLPHMEGTIVAGRNYVYCSTFQLAWEQVVVREIKSPVTLVVEGSPPVAEALGRGPTLWPEDLPRDGYFAEAGLVRYGVVEKIRKEMAARFPHAAFSLPDSAGAQAVVAYAYLEKSLPFAEAFDRLSDRLVFHGKTGNSSVTAWGIWRLSGQTDRGHALARQVTVLDYTGPDDFVVQFHTKSDDDQLVLAKVLPKDTLAATFAAVIERATRERPQRGSRCFEPGESLVVPIVSLKVSHEYEELLGKRLRNPMLRGLFIDAAQQRIVFRLDETGARLASDAYLGLKSALSREEPRRFVFDRPFLLYIRRTGSEKPYLVLWIENAELLEAR